MKTEETSRSRAHADDLYMALAHEQPPHPCDPLPPVVFAGVAVRRAVTVHPLRIRLVPSREASCGE
jgi:hypothetical protein